MLKNVIFNIGKRKLLLSEYLQRNLCGNINTTSSICQVKFCRNQNRQFSCLQTHQKQFLDSKLTTFLPSFNANLSGFFVKFKERPKLEDITRFNRDNHYEKIKNQNFGPVPIGRTASDRHGMTAWEYAKREHLEYDGVKYSELPIADVSARYNNTIVIIKDHTGEVCYTRCTCGTAGFKNARKKTQHAAEQTGKLAAEKAIIGANIKTVRVRLKGPGYGRMGAVRGLAMGGLNVASVSDITGLQFDGISERPRAIRRI